MSHQKRPSLAAGSLAGLVALGIALLVAWGPAVPDAPPPAEQTRALGVEMMTRSLLVFETAAVTILAAMIAAVVVAVARRR